MIVKMKLYILMEGFMLNTLTQYSEKILIKIPFTRFFTGVYYNRIIRKECALANITQSDKVLFIGGGAYPYSALYIHQLSKAYIDVIDYDKNKVRDARRCITPHEKPYISLIHADGLTVDVRQYDVIIVAKQITSKPEVIAHLLNTMTDKTRLVVRCKNAGYPIKAKRVIPIKYAFIKELRLYA